MRAALIVAPDCPEANRILGFILTQTNRAHFAKVHFERARASSTAHDLFVQWGWNARSRGAMDEALGIFGEGLIYHPESLELAEGLAAAHEAIGDAAAGERAIAGLMSRPGAIHALRGIAARLASAQGDHKRALSLLLADDLTHQELFDRGRYLEKLGRYAEAWRDWMTAKDHLNRTRGHIYNVAHQEAAIAALQSAADNPATLRIMESARADSARSARPHVLPLFIGGFPRSGTTMIETVLSAHPAIAAADELPYLNEIVRQLPSWLRAGAPYPAALAAFELGDNAGARERTRAYYLSRATQKLAIAGEDLQGRQFFTDKMPLNEMHLPLIGALFPESPFYYLRRHPLDIIVSNMSHMIVHGDYFASSVESAAYHYLLLDRLMRFYRDRLPYQVTEIRYESFVASPAPTMRAFFPAPLEPTDDCLAFHKNPRTARTISYNQVKKPLYTSSVERYRPFLPYLKPIVPALRELCAREGYEI